MLLKTSAFAVALVLASATAASAQEVRGGIGSHSGVAQITARGGQAGDAVRGGGGRAGGSSAPCRMLAPWGDKTALVPCDYQEGNAGPFLAVEPGAPAAPTAAQVGALAQQMVRELAMPAPRPVMSADTGITGAVHGVNLNTVSSRYFPTEATSFGPFVATAHGRFKVDWGDGTVEMFESTGGPWPNTDVSHAWQSTGNYTITVTGEWSVDWRLGGFSGVVTGLSTTGAIAGWPVIQAQAVIVD